MPPFFSHIDVMISGSYLYLAILAMALIALTIFVYRHTNPIVANWIRYLLMALRGFALFLLALVLFELTLQWQRIEKRPPTVAVLLDHSASMGQHDHELPRSQVVYDLLHARLPQHLNHDFQVRYYLFDNQTAEVLASRMDSLNYRGDATDITQALESVKSALMEQNLAAMVLLSDGNYTHGGDPARYAAEMGVPVHSIGIGSPQRMPDVGIVSVEANPFAFTGESTPIQVTLRNNGFKQQSTRLTLRDGAGEKQSLSWHLRTNPADTTMTLLYKPGREGRQKLTLELSSPESEENTGNNHYTFYVDVLKSKLRIYLLAGTASADVAFLRRHLTTSERFEIRVLTESGNGQFYEMNRAQAVMDSLDHGDLFVLYEMPTPQTSQRLLTELLKTLQQRPRPILFIAGEAVDWSRTAALNPHLPIRSDVLTMSSMEIVPLLTPQGQLHPLMQIPSRDITAWSLLPPVSTRYRVRSWWPDAEVLAQARIASSAAAGPSQDTWPFIVVRSSSNKSAAILGSDLWRWHLMMAGIGNSDEVYHNFLQNLVRWLQIERNTDLIRLQTDQASYHYGDQVHITAQVVDAQFKAIDDAEVQVFIKEDSSENAVFLAPAGKGSYTGVFRPETAGDFQMRAVVRRGEQTIGEANHLFSVGSYSQELSETILQEPLLRQVAHLSGGRYARPDSAGVLLASITGRTLERILTRDAELWHRSFMMIMILALLSLEWFIRRRKGML